MYHEHPLRILRYSAKNIWLLIFPLIRGLNAFLQDANRFVSWVRGAWFDIAILGAILIFGLIRWYCSRIKLTEDSIVHFDGVIVRLRTDMPYKNLSTVTAERPFYLLPMRGVRMKCDTSAGIFNSTDMKLLVSEKVCAEIMTHVPDIKADKRINGLPKPNLLSVILFSIFFSSGFSGTVYIVALMFKGGDIAREMITASINRITEETTKHMGRLIMKIPGAVIGVGVFFIAAWTLSFLVNILRYARFGFECDPACMKIRCGIFHRREYRISTSHINYADMRQNLIMKLLGAVTVNISCAGYGSNKRHLPVLLPIKREKTIGRELEKTGIYRVAPNQFRPALTGWLNYVYIPIWVLVLLIPAHRMISYVMPQFYDLSSFFALMFSIPAVWTFFVKCAAFATSGVAICDDVMIIRCCKFTSFHTVTAARSKLVKIELEQTVFQKLGRRCTISFWFEGEEHRKFRVKGLHSRDVNKIAEALDYDVNTLI
ncbi:MAG: PH domain-containing protein [Ruminococcus sp.]|nr:PH domain-containing protein [Ruminococcus sp.]